ncbi:MAG: DUF2939 domain-containing protein [Burkholderiaceae bacterium]|nr:DUF2939 domain-containing protein [Burkholderiaceae bacterium]
MKPKTLATAVAVLCVAAAGWLYATPYIALHQLGKAVERKDAQAVSAYVDFPALRDSIKTQMMARLNAQMGGRGPADNPLGNFGQTLAQGLVSQFTEALVSPEGVMLMLEKGKPGKPGDVAAAGVGVDTQGGPPRKDYAVEYQGWSKVFVHPKREGGGFVFRREGLAGWKLVAVQMD